MAIAHENNHHKVYWTKSKPHHLSIDPACFYLHTLKLSILPVLIRVCKVHTMITPPDAFQCNSSIRIWYSMMYAETVCHPRSL